MSKIIDTYLYNEKKENILGKTNKPKPLIYGRKPNVQPFDDITKSVYNESPVNRMCNVSLGGTIEKISIPDFPEIKDKMIDREHIYNKSPSSIASLKTVSQEKTTKKSKKQKYINDKTFSDRICDQSFKIS